MSEAYGRLPLSFEANRGQADPRVKFLARGGGYSLFLTSQEAVLALAGPASDADPPGTLPGPRGSQRMRKSAPGSVLRLKLLGANPSPQVKGLDELPGRSNYFTSTDPSKWQTNVPGYSRVKYGGVYEGIDLVFDGSQRRLEFDFIVAPGADPGLIRLGFEGVRGMRVDSNGDLVLKVGRGEIRQHRPIVYQEVGRVRTEVAGRYVLLGGRRVGIEVGKYDQAGPLIIDPVLNYSTYLGGYDSDYGYGIAVDAAGSAYVAGTTSSIFSFPTTPGAYLTGGGRAFVTKLNPAGTALVYSTYLAVSGLGSANAIAVDLSGNAYVTGTTQGGYPTTAGAYQTTYGGNSDAFITKLNSAGSALVYSTYLGGNGEESGSGIAVDISGNAYVTGITRSSNFPTTASAYQTTLASVGYYDTFVTKLNSGGTALVYSTYLGGSFNDFGTGLAIDASGNAYVTGGTYSSNFPTTTGAYQTVHGGGQDAFVTRLNSDGTGLIYSTYLGGSGGDSGNAIAVDSAGNAYVAGSTYSTNFPTTAGAYQTTFGGQTDAFVAKLNSTGSALVYSTYLGGSWRDAGYGIAVEAAGNAYVTGSTGSTNFPLSNAVQPACLSCPSNDDAFVAKLNSDGTALVYSTYLGGNSVDQGLALAVDISGNAYVTGQTDSTNFPTAVPFQPTSYPSDAFVTKIDTSSVAYAISGRVADGGGVGISGVTVSLAGSQVGTALTDTGGNYSFPFLAAGRNYTVTPSRTGYVFTPVSQTFSNLNANQTANFTGSLVYNITGRVINSERAQPLVGATVTLTGTQTGSTQTSFSGDYSFPNLPAGGNYTITPRKPGYNPIPLSRTFNNLSANQTADFDSILTDSVGGRLAKVSGAGVGALVTLSGSDSRTVDTDLNGNYLFNVAPGGNYTVTPSRSDFAFTPASQTINNLGGNQIANFRATQLYQIVGNVWESGTSFGVLGVTLTLTGSQTATTQTAIGGGGSYWLTGIAEGGTYTVTPSKADSVFDPPSRTFSNLSSDQSANFVRLPAYGVSGRLTSRAGAAITGARVTVTGSQTAAALSDGSGNYAITGLSAGGNYTVTPSAAGYLLTPSSQAFLNLSSNQTLNFTGDLINTGTLAPTADAYVQDGSAANTNFGSAVSLQVQTDTAADTGSNRDTYLKFDTTGVAVVSGATLRVYAVLSASGTIATSVYSVADATWAESVLTWNNRPPRGTTPLGTVNVTTTGYAWYDMDVTSYVVSERAAGRNVVSLALHNAVASSGWISLNSREAAGNGPQLLITTGTLTNTAPVVNAGADQVINLSAAANLRGSVSDDGLPNPPGAVTVTWSQVSGAGTVTFLNANALETLASFSMPGTYVLRLTATDGALTVFDEVSVTVNDDAGTPPVLDPDSGGVVNLRVYTPLRGLIP